MIGRWKRGLSQQNAMLTTSGLLGATSIFVGPGLPAAAQARMTSNTDTTFARSE